MFVEFDFDVFDGVFELVFGGYVVVGGEDGGLLEGVVGLVM